MLNLILADSELEQVPKEIAGHKTIRWQAQKRGRKPIELILNSSHHHRAMISLLDRDRRGRPDIVHSCLLQILDSPLNKEGQVRTYVHTRKNKVIKVDLTTNLPRMYNRFEGLIEQLFLSGAVPPEKPLLTLESMTLEQLLQELKPSKVTVFSEHGTPRKLDELFPDVKSDRCVIVGGFPHGDFLSPVEKLADETVTEVWIDMRKKTDKKIARERVERLLELAHETLREDPNLSKRHVALAWRIKTKFNLRLPRELKLKFCRKCLSYWLPGKTCRVRTRQKIITITCLECGRVYRLPIRKKTLISGNKRDMRREHEGSRSTSK